MNCNLVIVAIKTNIFFRHIICNDPITSFINILNGESEAKTIDGRRIYTLKQNKSEDGNIILEIEDYVNLSLIHI